MAEDIGHWEELLALEDAMACFRAKREHIKGVQGRFAESQGQNLALTLR